MRATVGLVLVLLAGPALAHDDAAWIQEGAFTSPVDGSHCCGERDCEALPDDAVQEVPGGYLIYKHEFVPAKEAQPSRDGRSWRCHFPSGARRCFFSPPAGS